MVSVRKRGKVNEYCLESAPVYDKRIAIKNII